MKKINRFSDLKFFIKKDLLAKGKKSIIKEFIASPVFRFTILLRVNEYLSNSNILFRIFPLIWYKRLGVRLGLSIPLNVFDYGLSIVHYGLTIVSPDAEIGKNCRIHAGVNIGGSAGFKAKGDNKKYAPKIGNNCYIGPGAKLFGAIIIGDNNVIGANAVVNKSFKNNNITIGGIPAKIISGKGSEGLVYKI
jgi:serine O-acetyltransferase